MRVLLIEDEENVAMSIAAMLKGERVLTDMAGTGEEGLSLARHYGYDVIILDLNLPDMKGRDVLRDLRKADIGTPVIVLSGDTALATMVDAFGHGADDYMTKPFFRAELVARLSAVARRSRAQTGAIISSGKLRIDVEARQAAVDGAPLALTAREYDLLLALATRKGLPLTKETLLDQLYGGVDEPERKIVDVFVCKLRKKIAQATGGENPIQTVWGLGYKFCDPAPLRSAA